MDQGGRGAAGHHQVAAVRPWWKTDPTGQVVMSVKFGAKPLEFEKGKAGIVVPSKDKLPAVIDTLISAVRSGELDELFNQRAVQPGCQGRIDREGRESWLLEQPGDERSSSGSCRLVTS